jgi:hypothetical protein
LDLFSPVFPGVAFDELDAMSVDICCIMENHLKRPKKIHLISDWTRCTIDFWVSHGYPMFCLLFHDPSQHVSFCEEKLKLLRELQEQQEINGVAMLSGTSTWLVG